MSTTTTTKTAVIAFVDPNAPAKVVQHVGATREPDFYDNGLAFWIGDDGTVAVPIEDFLADATADVAWAKAGLVDTLAQEGWYARTGVRTVEKGIAVLPHGDVPTTAPIGHAFEYHTWRMAHDTIVVD